MPQVPFPNPHHQHLIKKGMAYIIVENSRMALQFAGWVPTKRPKKKQFLLLAYAATMSRHIPPEASVFERRCPRP